ncbi:class I SAM-dependent methyltransferase [Nocardia stercoris]|nr:hypothetical protein [Nocardia stercoris]
MLIDELGAPGVAEIVERDDGHIFATPAARYVAVGEEWPELDRAAVAACAGRVLDVGAGAGRASLALQQAGVPVLALDTSAGAIAVCGSRGVSDTFHGEVGELANQDQPVWDSVLLLGNNLGLLASPKQAPQFLDALAAVTSHGARIYGRGTDPYRTSDPLHLEYHDRNRTAGRPGGQLRLRVRHRRTATGWFDYWLTSADELVEVLAATPWRLEDLHHSDQQDYLAVLVKR